MASYNWKIRQAVKALQAGRVIAYPTEAVYGLGCDPHNEQALFDLLALKQRDWLKGLIVIAADFDQLQGFIKAVAADVFARLDASWPGPVTWLLPARDGVSPLLTGFTDKIAVRVTAHPLAAKLCKAYGGAVVSTSANHAGLPPAQKAYQVRKQFPGLDFVLAGTCGKEHKPSQIIDALTSERIR